MGAKGGKLPSSAQPQAARQLRISSSSLGQVIPLIYGENRIAGNLIFAMYFTAQEIKSHVAAGKGGGPSGFFAGYNYFVSCLMAICEGALFADPAVPCSVPQQYVTIGRATPGGQVLTVSDKTGAEAAPQPVPGWSPAVWKTKKVRRIVNDLGKSPIPGDPDGEIDPDGDNKDDKKLFRPVRFHNWDEAPNSDAPVTHLPRFLTGPTKTTTDGPATGGVARAIYDFIWGAFKTMKSPNPNGGSQRQGETYRALAGENYFGIVVTGKQNLPLGSNNSLPNFNWPLRGLMQFRDVYATTVLVGAVSSGATSVTVHDTTGFVAPGTLRIEGELMSFSGLTSTTFTGLARGGGFGAAAHPDGATVWDDTAGGRGEQHGADPACILMDALTNPKHGAGWDRPQFTSMLPAWSNPWGALSKAPPADSWSAYCRAQNLLLNPIWDSQRSMSDILQDLADMTNTAIVWSEGKLKMIPNGDTAITAGLLGITFTPSSSRTATTDGANIAVRYDLGLDDFLPAKNKDAISLERRAVVPDVRADYKSDGLYNHVRVEFLNKENGYAVEVAEAKDQASIDDVGLIAREPWQLHEITTGPIAIDVAVRRLKRLVEVRNVYMFTLTWRHILLEPMDVVTLTDLDAGFDHVPVRITSISETKDGDLECEAEDFPSDFAGAALPTDPGNPDLVPSEVMVILGSEGIDPTFEGNPRYASLWSDQVSNEGTASTIGQPGQAASLWPPSVGHNLTALLVQLRWATRANTATLLSWRTEVRLSINGVTQMDVQDPFLSFTVNLTKTSTNAGDRYLNQTQEWGTSKVWRGAIRIPPGSQVALEFKVIDEFGAPAAADPVATWDSYAWTAELESA